MRFLTTLFALVALAAVAVPNAMAFRFTDEARNTPTGVTGQPYNHPITVAAGCLLVKISIGPGSLPPGIRLVGSPSDQTQNSWRFEGIPEVPGKFTFWINGGSEWPECVGDSTQEEWSINVSPGLAIQNSGFPVGTVNQPYPNQQLTAAGGGTQTWSIAGGALPGGLTLSSTGLISGTPTEVVQSKPVQIRVADVDGRANVRNYEISVRAPLDITDGQPQPTITSIDEAFTYGPLAVTGGSANKTWSIAAGTLPTGLQFSAATGAITGIPTQAGSFPVALRVADDEGRADQMPVVIQVASPVSITSRRFAALKAGRFYNLSIKTTGGVPIRRVGRDTMNWTVVLGKLPLGLRLNTRTGKLIGTPRKAGTYRFTIQVSDKFRSVDTQSFVLVVRR